MEYYKVLLTYLLTPLLPNVVVLGTSGLMQARFFLCSGLRIQSSQYLKKKIKQILKKNPSSNKLKINKRNPYDFGHFCDNSSHKSRVSIHPSPGKKSVLYNKCAAFSSIKSAFPLSFHAETHHSDLSATNNGYVPKKYSKKSGAISKSSSTIIPVSNP